MNTKSQTPDTAEVTDTSYVPKSQSDRQRIINLAVGDVLVFLIFATIGIRSHDEALSIPKVLVTAAPFVVAWFLISPFIGVFRREFAVQPRKMVQRTLLAWIVSWPVALLFRGLIEWKVPPLSFALVTLFTNMLLLLIWRWPFAIVNRKRQKSDC